MPKKPALARRRVEPTWLSAPEYVETFGPIVSDLCARADFAPDPEQEQILDLVFAIKPDGTSAAFEVDLIGPRQNFKTGVLKMMEIGWLYVTKQRLIIHSAHELSTTEETFRETADLIESAPFLSSKLAPTKSDRPGITTGNGKWSIELVGDRRIKYRARRNTGGRGLTGDKVVLDEAFALLPSHIGSLYPTLAAVADPQVVSASSAGMLESEILRDKRDRGRAGSSRDQVYVEFGDREQPTHERPDAGCQSGKDCTHSKTTAGCVLDDEDRWAEIMPALGRRVKVETIRSMRQAMPPAEFAREFLVWWDDPPLDIDQQVFGTHWRRQAAADAQVPTPVCVGISVEFDARRWGALGAFGVHGDSLGIVFPAAIAKGPNAGPGRRPGTAWIVPAVCDIAARHPEVMFVIDGGGPAADLVEPLERKIGGQLTVVTLGDAKDACAGFFDGITETKTLMHNDDVDLNEAARSAVKRFSGDRFLWGRRQSAGDISLLDAVTLAFWGGTRTSVYEHREMVIL